MTEAHYNYGEGTFECVDANPEFLPNLDGDESGGNFFFVEPDCNDGAHCPPYTDDAEITCVVCSK